MKIANRILSVMGMLLLPVLCMAQPDGFGGFGGDAPVPLDGGLAMVVAGSVAYGAKKLHDRRKQQAEVQETQK